uniref:Uncharacterized protein n=1 Tax=Chromera velia CCMP2878 TaxID=1169474 RepID=A0A0G4HCB1_9ALVE|eukprot:Cvel_6238.t1-p1 / transcript=Cvel_6238.t1 / gene=Cvel_6238 / organism=Chromera_velia_CCMP2878 / gene_product=hypothetical protein / transcript_product=hypothetical protein / location=Cvel_scaffold302:22753-23280(-) / protein_length=176 / sequence_SO=supercontig / SO=protein_coding / is_pseudo=false
MEEEGWKKDGKGKGRRERHTKGSGGCNRSCAEREKAKEQSQKEKTAFPLSNSDFARESRRTHHLPTKATGQDKAVKPKDPSWPLGEGGTGGLMATPEVLLTPVNGYGTGRGETLAIIKQTKKKIVSLPPLLRVCRHSGGDGGQRELEERREPAAGERCQTWAYDRSQSEMAGPRDG